MQSRIWNLLSGKAERRVMSDTYWRDRIDVAGETLAGSNVKSRIATVARMTSVSVRTVRALYFGEVSEPKYSAGRVIDDVAEQQAARFLALADRLEATDAEFHRESIDRMRALAGRIRRAG